MIRRLSTTTTTRLLNNKFSQQQINNNKNQKFLIIFNNNNNNQFYKFYSSTTTTTMNGSPSSLLKLGMCQLNVGSDKQQNIKNAIQAIEQAATEQGAQLITLPECFNCPYGNKYFAEYAEELETSETLKQISDCAKKFSVYIIAGSIPTRVLQQEEKQPNEYLYYNTSVVFDNQGNRIAVHNKVHLFDINVPNKIVFQESAVLTAGQSLTSFEMKLNAGDQDQDKDNKRVIKVGLGICFDIRFPEMAQIYQRQGCELLVYPGAFNMTTGPAHWQLLCRSRAVDNQLYVCVVSPARDTGADYVAYGHSMICSPWGDILTEMDEKSHVITTEINMDTCQEIRQQIPAIKNRRLDLYDVILKNK